MQYIPVFSKLFLFELFAAQAEIYHLLEFPDGVLFFVLLELCFVHRPVIHNAIIPYFRGK